VLKKGFLWICLAAAAAQAAPGAPHNLRVRGTGNKCPILSPASAWNRDISQDPVDPNSANYMAAMNAGSRFLHPDFGSNPDYGIPWIVVPGHEPRVPVAFHYDDESDPGPYPIPLDAPVEGGPDSTGDRHILAIDRDTCVLYELYAAYPEPASWVAGSGAVFDLRSGDLQRQEGWTSADAAGLPVFPGLVKRDEALSGEIHHAFRFTMARTQRAYVHPASHWASSNMDPDLPPMGLRVRLKASYDISGLTGPARAIAAAMKKYGMILADNGSDWYFTGERNTAWDDANNNQLKRIPASAFEVVRHGPVFKDW